jgi:2-C-methyl-D-erythritol 2,4-cyclodiphosphate synthase
MHRVGLGHDTHRLAPGKPLIIGGVTIPHDVGPVAHSDGDVLLHAITDAILGAAGLGDIGEWFPDTDLRYQNADSAELLKTVLAEIHHRGWQVVNIDCTIHAQKPKLSTFKPQIAQRIATLLEIDPSSVNVKAKTGEQVGPIGREEALSADAVILLERASHAE